MTRNEYKAYGFDRISRMDGLPADVAEIIADTTRCLESAEPDEGDNRRDYWDSVEAEAAEALAEHPADEQARCDRVCESVDGSQWVIYFYRARMVLQFSDNDNAGLDDGLVDMASCTSFDDLCTKLAFCAMERDVMERLERMVKERDKSIEDTIGNAVEAGAVELRADDKAHGLDLDDVLYVLESEGNDAEIWAVREDGSRVVQVWPLAEG